MCGFDHRVLFAAMKDLLLDVQVNTFAFYKSRLEEVTLEDSSSLTEINGQMHRMVYWPRALMQILR